MIKVEITFGNNAANSLTANKNAKTIDKKMTCKMFYLMEIDEGKKFVCGYNRERKWFASK